jgi:hypothetical protein
MNLASSEGFPSSKSRIFERDEEKHILDKGEKV